MNRPDRQYRTFQNSMKEDGGSDGTGGHHQRAGQQRCIPCVDGDCQLMDAGGRKARATLPTG
jgi:hypothetical protein